MDIVYDCSDHPVRLKEESSVVRRGAEIVLVGIYTISVELPANALVRGEVAVLGTYGITPEVVHKEHDKNARKMI